MAKVDDSDIELAEKGKNTEVINTNDDDVKVTETDNPLSSSPRQKHLDKTDTQVQRDLNEDEKQRINAEFLTNPSFKNGVCRMQAVFRGHNNRKEVAQKKLNIIMDFQKSIVNCRK